MTGNPMIAAALGYASRGLPVLPLWSTDQAGQCACDAGPGKCKAAGKHPNGLVAPHGCKDASFDQRTIASWWRRYPLANVGIATGGTFRLLVIDVDPDAGGEHSLAELERRHGPLPATVQAITPRGGRHVYLIVPDGRPLPSIGASAIAAGIDHRCEGGYVAAPPSAVGTRPYAWSVDSADRFAEAPEWLLAKLPQGGGNGEATRPEQWLELVLAGVDEGARNHTIAKLAGLLFRKLPEPGMAAELVACFNATKCRPPLEPAELKRTIDSIADREMRRRGLQP